MVLELDQECFLCVIPMTAEYDDDDVAQQRHI